MLSFLLSSCDAKNYRFCLLYHRFHFCFGFSGEHFGLVFCRDIWYRCSVDPSRLDVYLDQLSVMLRVDEMTSCP